MAYRSVGKRELTQQQIDDILFNSDSDLSDLSDEEVFSDRDVSIVCPTTNMVISSSESEDSEEENLGNEINLTWCSNSQIINVERKNFDGNSGPKHSLPPGSSELDYFKEFFNDEMLESIRSNTNNYADFKSEKKKKIDEDWKPIEGKNEMWAFIAILLIMSLVRMHKLRDYWSTNPILGHEMVKRIMPRNRFLKILQYFHISNREDEKVKGDPDYNQFQKLEPLASILKLNFQNMFQPYKELSVDEALIKFKGRLGIVQYMPLKPAKRGLKVWMLSTSYLGYVYNFNVYGGRNDAVERTNNGLGYDVVMNLIRPLKEKFHVLYYDRFFSSVQLILDLLKKKTYACGTVLKNRKRLPLELRHDQLKTQGEIIAYQCNEEKQVLCSSWYDKKQISILSTNVNHNVVKVHRRKGKEKNEVDCPESFKLYNQYMGGVDLADQKRKYYSISRKSMKWWYYLFWFLIDTTIVNSFIVMTVTHFPQPQRPQTLRDFKMKLIEQLVRDFSSRKRTGTTVEDFYEHEHKRKKICGSKKTCLKCRKNNVKTKLGHAVQSSWECETCKICLCKNCFE